ncbi:MAG: GNAT family N-acetyltransferase [Zoogloeaceae bacterium]|nr:GNAT family N-acetyltransferase [Zoogloeaceae bacterium]
MKLTVSKLTPEYHAAYDAFLRASEGALFFASLEYRKLLKDFLGAKAEDHYFLAVDEDGEIKGVLPSFVTTIAGFGPIANSLPFYGSNGGVITRAGDRQVIAVLLNHFYEFTVNIGCSSSTVVASPFEVHLDVYETSLNPTYKDSRIGQFTPLPIADRASEEVVMSALHHKTRNMVRKAFKQGINVTDDIWDGAVNFLCDTHAENMAVIGGRAKPARFFRAIDSAFKYGKDYKLYTAWLDGAPVAALLLFYFNGFVEYFTPVIVARYRSSQPMSLLIFNAMTDAVANGYKWWNWGGTWHTQDGVYQFKRSWGAVDKPYYYYIRIGDENVLRRDKEALQKDAPYFYVAPFDKLVRI